MKSCKNWFLFPGKCRSYIPVVKRNSLALDSFHPFVPVTIETGNESRVVTMATGLLDTGTAYKIMAWGKFQEEGRLKQTLTVSKVLSLTDKYRSSQPISVVSLLRRRSAVSRLLGLQVRIPPGYGCPSLVSVGCC